MGSILHWQLTGEELEIATWPGDDEHVTYPEGSRTKRLLRCPIPSPRPWLVAGHRYLFKESRSAFPSQFWAEIAAARLGQLCGVPVPPAYAALDQNSGVSAALIEWFYGYQNEPPQRFVSGGSVMKGAIPNFDHQKGRQHNLTTIENWFSRMQAASSSAARIVHFQADWIQAWARTLAFDALIGNTDRHQENWGLLLGLSPDDSATMSIMLSPAFDNGTALGYELVPSKVLAFLKDKNWLRSYISRGHHHMRWQLADKHQAQHVELLLQLAKKHPQSRPAMLSVLQVSDQQFSDAILPLCTLRLPVAFTHDRAALMLHLLSARRDILLHRLTSP